MDFSYATLENMLERLDRNINPFTGLKFSNDEKEIVTDMMLIIHAAVQNYAVEFYPVYVEMPILELSIKITERTNIGTFTQKISDSIAFALCKQTEVFSQLNIQNKLHRFLLNCDLIELRENKYNDNKRQYYATKKGEKCGLINQNAKTKNGKKWHTLLYSAYMQAYLLRIFPEIFVEEIKFEFNKTHNYESLISKVEPISLKEQDLIFKYRSMNKTSKELFEADADLLLERQ